MTPYDRLVELRAAYPPALTPAQIGEILNTLAWEFKDEQMMLLGKRGGNNVPQPGTGIPISSDYLVHRVTLLGVDALSGRDDGTTTTVGFTWPPPDNAENLNGQIGSGARTLVEPVAPTGAVIDPPPGPGIITPPPPSDLAGRVTTLEKGAKADHKRMEDINDRFVGESDGLNVHTDDTFDGRAPTFGGNVASKMRTRDASKSKKKKD